MLHFLKHRRKSFHGADGGQDISLQGSVMILLEIVAHRIVPDGLGLLPKQTHFLQGAVQLHGAVCNVHAEPSLSLATRASGALSASLFSRGAASAALALSAAISSAF